MAPRTKKTETATPSAASADEVLRIPASKQASTVSKPGIVLVYTTAAVEETARFVKAEQVEGPLRVLFSPLYMAKAALAGLGSPDRVMITITAVE